MNEIIQQIETYIVLYTPTVLTVIGTLVTWLKTTKSLKSIKVKEDIEDSLKTVNTRLDDVIMQNKILSQDNEMLRAKLNALLTELSKVKVDD